MAAALALGRRGLGCTAPNPAVGALVVADGVIVGRGFTRVGGRPHAETEALTDAGAKARGATLYVSLEPCSHFGATPPCTDAILAAGIARVVSALDDPDPRVRGAGHARLSKAGIAVTVGVGAEEAGRTNLGHILRSTIGRPMVTLKLAETADGYVAGDRHDPRLMITGEPADLFVHVQRAMHDAIMIGRGTLIADDPLLTVRLPGLEARKPLRIVLDSQLALPLRSRLVTTARAFPTLAIAADDANGAAAKLAEHGVEIMRVVRGREGSLDLAAALAGLANRGLTRIFSEGGPGVARSLIAGGLADEVLLLTAAKRLNREGVAAFDEATRARLADPALYRLVGERFIGADRLRHFQRRL
jgi:diaminohydroxyphosphoribosylaminopyrimidine deaminase/5-amino-6-(5-phosphoribosylamino)uracil reductase